MSDLHIDVISRIEDLRRRDDDWIRLCTHPEAHPAVFAAIARVDANLIRPHVVLVSRNGTAVAIAVARIQNERIAIKFGLARLPSARLRVVRVSYEGVAGDLSPEVFKTLCDAVAEPLATGEADALFLDHVRVASLPHDWSGSPSGGMVRDFAPADVSRHWVTPLGGGYEAVLGRLAKRERASLTKKKRTVEHAFANRLRVECYYHAGDLERIAADTGAVAAHTYQRKIGVSFSDQFWAVPLLRGALSIGAARCYILYVDDAPKAFCHGLVWRGAFQVTFMGYHPDMSSYGIGRYLVHHAIADLCRLPAVTSVDFGFGHAEYKRRLCRKHWDEVDRYVFAPRAKPIAVNLLRGVIGHLALGSDRLLAALGLRERIKSLWWRRLTAPRPAEANRVPAISDMHRASMRAN